MDKIWDKESFEVGGLWPLWRGWKKTNDHAEPTKVDPRRTNKSRTLKKLFQL